MNLALLACRLSRLTTAPSSGAGARASRSSLTSRLGWRPRTLCDEAATVDTSRGRAARKTDESIFDERSEGIGERGGRAKVTTGESKMGVDKGVCALRRP